MKQIRTASLLIVLALLTAGCASTKPGSVPKYTGFLPDYSLLHPGKKGQAERVYIKSGVDWAGYSKVMLDPVTIWRGKNSQMHGISHKDAQTLANYFYNLIYHKLSKDYQMVSEPGPKTLRISVAIVKLEEGHVALETISTVVPQLNVATKLVSLVSGWSPLVGKASVEAKITDAETGTLLAEGVDERIGNKSLSSISLKSWGDVEHVMRFWVDRSSYNLCKASDRSDCVAPSGI